MNVLNFFKNKILYMPLLTVMVAALIAGSSALIAQTQPELEKAQIRMGHVWCGVTANGGKGNFDYRAGFFPNDYDILGVRGQYREAWAGGGFQLTTTNWVDPLDSLHIAAIYGPTNEFRPIGKVVEPMTNFIRYTYPEETVDFQTVDLEPFGAHAPEQFGEETYDQVLKVTTENILGVEVKRKIMAWTQNFHNDYILVDVTLTSVIDSTLYDFYINMKLNGENTFRSNGNNPSPAAGERFDPAVTWQHYYGGRVGDSLRVFYEYSADEPEETGDDMGAPAPSQGGRLLNPNYIWYSILHASETPFSDPSEDQDDFLQPRVTYIGKDNLIPYNEQGDEFGSKNYWAIRGGYSEFWPMTGNTWPNTFHGGNSDEMGSADYASHPGGSHQAGNSKMWSSFGPYTLEPGKSIRIVYASGYTGLSLEMAKQVGEQWLEETLKDPPGIPNERSGYFPDNFVFPQGATEMDKIKDRWLSTGIDSVMKSASRAKWNFKQKYQVPQAPPPPSMVEITGLGTGVEIRWSNSGAEEMDNFAGHRIMRRISNMDTVFYQEIYRTSPDDKADEHLYVDKDVLIGAQYYYYIQAIARIPENDLKAHPTSRGKLIYSSRVLEPNIYWINPPHFSQQDLNKIRIVPNPYNINDPLLVEQGFTDQRAIQFFNLPPGSPSRSLQNTVTWSRRLNTTVR
ncbi:MAG: hypothetical protein U5R06_07470 [candidate division KSB1 bacterium]|nr:hypothetical protein [candidate division KSB1 bacterium]